MMGFSSSFRLTVGFWLGPGAEHRLAGRRAGRGGAFARAGSARAILLLAAGAAAAGLVAVVVPEKAGLLRFGWRRRGVHAPPC